MLSLQGYPLAVLPDPCGVSDVVGELYLAGVCGVVDQVLGLKMGSNLCCESCLRALCSLLCAKVGRLSSSPFRSYLLACTSLDVY